MYTYIHLANTHTHVHTEDRTECGSEPEDAAREGTQAAVSCTIQEEVQATHQPPGTTRERGKHACVWGCQCVGGCRWVRGEFALFFLTGIQWQLSD